MSSPSLTVYDDVFMFLFRNDNEVAFNVLYKHTFYLLLNWSNLHLDHTSLEDREDYIADAYMMLWINRKKMEHLKHIKNFLFTVVKHGRITEWRIRQKELLYFKSECQNMEYDEILQEKDDPIREELKEILHLGINRLPPKIKEVIQLNFIERKSSIEIAKKLNKPLRTIQNRRKKGIDHLMQLPYVTKKERKRIYLLGLAS